jgi:predicted ribosome quality control (RQC) complex YloA/Tae2 family protein
MDTPMQREAEQKLIEIQRDAIEQLQRDNKELREQNEALMAYVGILRGALTTVDRILYDDCFTVGMPAKQYIELALEKTPQSLEAHDMEIAERVREACAMAAIYWDEDTSPHGYIEEAIRNLDLSSIIDATTEPSGSSEAIKE